MSVKAVTTTQYTGTVCSTVGGLYEVYTAPEGLSVCCRARGTFRHAGIRPLAGDRVQILRENEQNEWRIEQILPRRCTLLRPALANLDVLALTVAAKDPAPDLLYIDKLLAIAEYHEITPVLIVNKYHNAPQTAEYLQHIYSAAGYTVFLTDLVDRTGTEPLIMYLRSQCTEKIAAFCGPSGVGKSTMLNTLFPTLHLVTGAISEKIARGKHTTRAVSLYPLQALLPGTQSGFLADTPGFSMLDFVHFDFIPLQALPQTFQEFRPFLSACRFKKCTHTKEQGCAVREAVRSGVIAAERHASYCTLWEELKDKRPWKKT